jgi:hypothetical protein
VPSTYLESVTKKPVVSRFSQRKVVCAPS